VLSAPLTPTASLSPSHTHLLLLDNERYPPIAEVAQPMLPLAGVRINPRTNGLHLSLLSHTGIAVVNPADASQKRVALSAGANFGTLRWTGDGKRFAFTATFENRIELWVVDSMTASGRGAPPQKNIVPRQPRQGGDISIFRTCARRPSRSRRAHSSSLLVRASALRFSTRRRSVGPHRKARASNRKPSASRTYANRCRSSTPAPSCMTSQCTSHASLSRRAGRWQS
jgi:hypothetical protein